MVEKSKRFTFKNLKKKRFAAAGALQGTRSQRKRLQVWPDEGLLSTGKIRRVRPDYEVRPRKSRATRENCEEVAHSISVEKGAVVCAVSNQTYVRLRY
jgi:hypothetical protein